MTLTVNRDVIQRVTDKLIERMHESYIFPEPAAAFETHLRGRLAQGAYATIADPEALRSALTNDLQEVTHDRHLRVEYNPDFYTLLSGLTQEDYDNYEPDADTLDMYRRDNYGFRRVERLTGNIGYIKFNFFAEAKYGGATVDGVMGMVANCDALIFDVRQNGGGAPNMVQYLCSYLFGKATHLNDIYVRRLDKAEQYHTYERVPGKPFLNRPVYVLTSSRTFSAAEEFTYNLQQLKRATIVGETTGGGAHPITPRPLDDGYIVTLCEARAVNPISGTNWEGTGITPDIVVPAADALATAHLHALEALQSKQTAEKDQRLLVWDLATAKGLYTPVPLTPAELDAVTGTYGAYRFERVNAGLQLTFRGFKSLLTSITPTTFINLDQEAVRFEFVVDGNQPAAAVERVMRDNGERTRIARDG